MTTVATRARAISDLEEFDIQVTRGGKPVDPTLNGILTAYPFEKKQKSGKTVAEWIRERFEPNYPGFSCNVLKGNGEIAALNTLLRTVRESYDDEN